MKLKRKTPWALFLRWCICSIGRLYLKTVLNEIPTSRILMCADCANEYINYERTVPLEYPGKCPYCHSKSVRVTGKLRKWV